MTSAPEAPVSQVFGLPRVPRTVIHRPRLTEMIADLLGSHDLVIVRAPAGAGKTVALADWAASGATEGYISWAALDERYADRTSFWREVILGTALRLDPSSRLIVTEFSDSLLAGADPRVVLRRFVRHIPPTIIVIDQIDLILDAELVEDMLWVLQQCPQLKAIVTTRGRSLLESTLVALRLDAAVIDAIPLRLSLKETEQLLALRGIPMDAIALHTATAGHPLLTRATMTVHGQSGNCSVEASVQSAVSDFLQMSLANPGLGQRAKDFMVRTSIPESFTIDLAEQLTGGVNTAELLDDLEDQGLGMWFRYKDTLRFEYSGAVRELLQKSLKTVATLEMDRLIRIVVDDDLAAGNALSALRKSVSLGDLSLASQIACDHHMTLLLSQSKAVLGILESLPLSRLRKHPVLIMALALCHNATSAGTLKAMEYFASAVACAALYRSSMSPLQRIWTLVLETTALRFAGKLEPAMKKAQRSVEAFEEASCGVREQLAALEPTLYVQAAISFIHDQQFDVAADLLRKALDAGRRTGSLPSIFLTTGLLAFTLATDGRAAEARVHLAWLNDARWPPGMLDTYWATTYRLAQVRDAVDRQSFTEASGYLDLINDEMQVSEFWTTIVGFRALLDLLKAGPADGPATLEVRIRNAHRAPLSSSGQVDLDCLRAVIFLFRGQPMKGVSALKKYTKPIPRVLLLRALISLSMGEPAKTLKLTDQSLTGLGPRLEVGRLLLHAAALWRLGDSQAAQDNARAAASLMSAHSLSMASALLPPEDLAVLVRYMEEGDVHVKVPTITLPPTLETASLTPRELVVLNSFALHGSANAVAADLNVSINTVKSQRRSILKKLDATSMEEALTVARRQRLLED